MNLGGGFSSWWILSLYFGFVFTDIKNINSSNHSSSSSYTQQELISESPETIQSLNPWVRIPDDWADPSEDDDSKEMNNHQSEERSNNNGRREREQEPFFEHAMMTNLTEQVDSHVFLRCRVKNLGDRTVSWIRRRDWHILTSGRIVYTTDDRFKIRHVEGSEEWVLVIEYVQTRDDGTYECQVSTSKGTISHFFNLQVLVPQAFILGAKEYHVQEGTVISLVCIVENSPRESPQYLYWYHNNVMVNYGSRVSVHTEPGIHTHSRLTVASAGPQHSGNYTCKAANTQPASVYVYVSEGDKTAAMQGRSSTLVKFNLFKLLLLLFLIPNL